MKTIIRKIYLRRLLRKQTPLQKRMILFGFTSNRTGDIKKLKLAEVNNLIRVYRPRTVEDVKNQMVYHMNLQEWTSNVLAAAEKAGIKKAGSWSEFNHWMLTKSKFKKQLNHHSISELRQLHQQLIGAKNNNDKSAKKPLTKAWFAKAEEYKNWN